MGFRKVLKRNNNNNVDRALINELRLVIDNDSETYNRRELPLMGNYHKKIERGKFNFDKAERGVFNLIVTPQARKYQNEWGVKVGISERKAIARGKTRDMFRSILDGNWR
jgi:hypothetical protein